MKVPDPRGGKSGGGGKGQSGIGGQGKGNAPKRTLEQRELERSLTWLRIDASRPLVPVVLPNDANRQVLSGGCHVLADLVHNDAEDVTLDHDVDWNVFPEIVDALRRESFDEVSFCLATSQSQDKWGVGVAGKHKLREQAARVALAVALASDLDDFEPLAELHADFAAFCSATGMNTGTLPGNRPHYSAEPPSKKRRLHEERLQEVALDGEPWVAKYALDDPEGECLPRQAPIWIALPTDAVWPHQLKGLPPEGLVLSHDGRNGSLYNKADRILAMFASPDEIQSFDDPSWQTFPGIGHELRRHSSRDECLHVLWCPGRDVWAVGVAMRSRNRIAAAKIALATSLALQDPTPRDDPGAVDLQASGFEDLVVKTRCALDDLLGASEELAE